MHPNQFIASFILAPLVAGASISSLGCYSTVPNLKGVKQYTFQSHGYCVNQCTEAGFHIAALQDGTTCGCSNTIPLSSAKVADDQCDQYCAGWPEDKCGGIHVYTVLTTGEYSPAEESGNSSAVATTAGGIIVAPSVNPSSMPTGILTAPSSLGNNGITALPSASKSSVAGITAVASTMTPSATPNAAGNIRSGPITGILFAGLGLLL